MKKIAFGIFILAALFFLIRILKILIFDLSRLTEWGYGYLMASILYFLLFSGLSIFLGAKLIKTG